LVSPVSAANIHNAQRWRGAKGALKNIIVNATATTKKIRRKNKMEAFLLNNEQQLNLSMDMKLICEQQMRPSTLYKPRVYPDGNMWCALYGENIQEGVTGFGKSPELAMLDFDDNWHKEIKGTGEIKEEK
jgi:hypothetical protein